MPILDPCVDGCPSNTTQNRPPGATDDPCNNSGLGYFCLGSWWVYDPTLPGANTAVDGECPRAFLRIGGNCNVAEWLEIGVVSFTEDTTDPVDGVNCCPASAVWHNTVSDEYFISLGDCTWCLLCIPEHTSFAVNAEGLGVTYTGVGNIPLGTTNGLAPASASITNTTTRSMTVQINWTGYGVDYSHQKSTPDLNFRWTVQPHFRVNGVEQANPFATDAFATLADGPSVFELDYRTSPWTTTVILAPGATVTADMDATFINLIPSDADLNQRLGIDNGKISMQAVTI